MGGENGVIVHGSLKTSAKIPVIQKTNLKLGSSENDERIKKKKGRKLLCH